MKVITRTHSNRFTSDNIGHKKVELEGQPAKTLITEGNLTLEKLNWKFSYLKHCINFPTFGTSCYQSRVKFAISFESSLLDEP